MSALSGIESLLSLFTAFLLDFPGVVTFEVDHASACETIFLGDNVPKVDIRVGILCISDDVSAVVQSVDRTSPQVIGRHESARLLPVIETLSTSTDQHINRDLRLIIDQVFALIDGILDVDVGGCGAIDEQTFAFPVVRREHCRDRC